MRKEKAWFNTFWQNITAAYQRDVNEHGTYDASIDVLTVPPLFTDDKPTSLRIPLDAMCYSASAGLCISSHCSQLLLHAIDPHLLRPTNTMPDWLSSMEARTAICEAMHIVPRTAHGQNNESALTTPGIRANVIPVLKELREIFLHPDRPQHKENITLYGVMIPTHLLHQQETHGHVSFIIHREAIPLLIDAVTAHFEQQASPENSWAIQPPPPKRSAAR